MNNSSKMTTGFINWFNLDVNQSAFIRLSTSQKLSIFLFLILIGLCLVLNFLLTLQIIFTFIISFYFLDLLFNLFLIYRSFNKEPEITFTEEEIASRSTLNWPTYTIFCPLYREWEVVPQFIEAISKIDYPKDKLEVQLLLEEDDVKTIGEIQKMPLPPYFKVIVVPDSKPKTKPKACNYGLLFAKGEYCVIYDAEDIPDPKQLKKAIMAFEKLGAKTGCVQAKLHFYNSHHNLLTKLFAADYSLWFNLVLTGLQSIHAPIPLGGTSNHFKTNLLKDLGAWDSFNVTEDADLGIRLAKKGYTTAVIHSITLEEATSNIFNWYKQRSRWIKGYIQTYLVHSRNAHFGNDLTGIKNYWCFQILVGGKIFSLFINPLMWLLTISYFVFRPIIGETVESLFFAPVFYAGVVSLVLGNFLYMYYLMLGLTRTRQWDLVIFAFATPLYWLMISISAFNALYELIRRPFHWNKTVHGAHLKKVLPDPEKIQLPGRVSLTNA